MTEEPAPSSEPVVPTPAPATPAPAAAPDTKKKATTGATYIWGTGRRKASVARVRIRPGSGKFIVNKREVKAYFCIARDQLRVYQPLEITENQEAFDVFVNVSGGGITGQSDAIVLGLARALLKSNPDYIVKLKEKNLLTRDPRRVERKKYGQRGARRRFQFSKR